MASGNYSGLLVEIPKRMTWMDGSLLLLPFYESSLGKYNEYVSTLCEPCSIITQLGASMCPLWVGLVVLMCVA